MKKIFVFVCAVAVLQGCASMEVKRGVQDNIFFSSSNPTLNIWVAPDFRYTKEKSETKKKWSTWGDVTLLNVKYEQHKFIGPDGKGFIISIQEIKKENSFWLTEHFSKVKHKIDEGKVKISGKQYDYCVAVDSYATYCILWKKLVRIMPTRKNCIVILTYYQVLRDAAFCSNWQNGQMPEAKQKRVDRFLSDSDRDFKIEKFQLPASQTKAS